MPLFVNAEKLPYGGRFGVIEQNRPYQTSDLLQKNETSFSSVCRPEVVWLIQLDLPRFLCDGCFSLGAIVQNQRDDFDL